MHCKIGAVVVRSNIPTIGELNMSYMDELLDTQTIVHAMLQKVVDNDNGKTVPDEKSTRVFRPNMDGICALYGRSWLALSDLHIPVSSTNINYNDLIIAIIKSWPLYSGYLYYFIPSPDRVTSPVTAWVNAGSLDGLWNKTTEYGQLRRSCLHYIVHNVDRYVELVSRVPAVLRPLVGYVLRKTMKYWI